MHYLLMALSGSTQQQQWEGLSCECYLLTYQDLKIIVRTKGSNPKKYISLRKQVLLQTTNQSNAFSEELENNTFLSKITSFLYEIQTGSKFYAILFLCQSKLIKTKIGIHNAKINVLWHTESKVWNSNATFLYFFFERAQTIIQSLTSSMYIL